MSKKRGSRRVLHYIPILLFMFVVSFSIFLPDRQDFVLASENEVPSSREGEASEKEEVSKEKTSDESKEDRVQEDKSEEDKKDKKKEVKKKEDIKKDKEEKTDKEDVKTDEKKKEIKKKNEKKDAKKKDVKKKKAALKKAKKKPLFNGKKVYLTFDDGPSENTDEVLKILDEYGVKGTFFVIGKEDKDSLRRYKNIVKKGHTIALHSYTHNYKQIYKNLKEFKKDFKRIDNLIYKTTGVRSKYYRFPGGTSNTVSPTSMKVFVDYFNKTGIRYYDWNVQCGDAVKSPPSPYTLYMNVVNGIKGSKLDSFIVLIHDSKPMKNSVKALPHMIKWLQENRYEILPIDDHTVPVHHSIAVKKDKKV